jgi:hypothetical protein
MSLVLHVCKETDGLESLFLISKSNCAFANFKDEDLCSAAQLKVHDSKFQTVRLVSRLRRSLSGAGAGVSIPTGPAALSPPSNSSVSQKPWLGSDNRPKEDIDIANEGLDIVDEVRSKDKFFIVKSLTVEDLELSVRNGIWATQAHNEEALNKAYQVGIYSSLASYHTHLFHRQPIMSTLYFLPTNRENILATQRWFPQ